MDGFSVSHSFFVALSVRGPVLLAAVVGLVLSWRLIWPASVLAHWLCCGGVLALAAHAVLESYSKARIIELSLGGAARDVVFESSAWWAAWLYALQLLAIGLLIAAAVSGRRQTGASGSAAPESQH